MQPKWIRRACYEMATHLPASFIRLGATARASHPWLRRGLDWFRDALRNHDGVIRHGVANGLLFNTGPSNVGFLLGSAEPEVQMIFQRLIRPGYVVYDIGANVGFLTIIAARLV